MIKRVGAVTLLSLLAIGQMSSAKVVTIRFWTWATPELMKVEEQLAREFEQSHPTIKVKIESPSPDVTILIQKLLASMAGNAGPDVTWTNGEFGPQLASQNLLLDLNKLAKSDRSFDADDFTPSAMKTMAWKGVQFGYPEGCSAQYIFYNKTMLDKAGLVAPTGEYTWDEAIQMAKKMAVKRGNRYEQSGISIPEWWWTSVNAIFQFGGELWTDDLRKCTINSKEAIKGIQTLKDLTDKYEVMPRGGADFLSGKVGMASDGYWRFMDIPKKVKFQWGTMVVPKGTNTATWLSVGGPAILRSTKHPKEAWEFVKFRVSKRAMLLDHSDGHSFPTRESLLKTREFMNTKVFPETARDALFLTHKKFIHYLAPTPGMPTVESIIGTGLSSIYSGKVSVEDGLNKLVPQIERWIKPRR